MKEILEITLDKLDEIIEQQTERIKELEAENKQLLELSENLNEHPEGYNGPCLCQLCKSYG